jgi:molecular chaperone DnaJ
MSSVKRDYYEVLGVQRDASDDEVKKAFRALARRLHPDVSDAPDAQERFREVAEAYEVLSDREARARYDRFGHAGMSGREFHTEQFMDLGNLGDLFGALFGRDVFTQAGPRQGADAEAEAEIELADAAFGTKVELDVDLVVPCESCSGTGAEPPTQPVTCPGCGGSGQVRQVARSAFGQIMRTGACPQCGGRGSIVESPCRTCRGRGRRAENRQLSIAVPAGIDDGQSIRVARQGHAGEPGGRPGDLYVRVHVKPDRRFERDGVDLVTVVDLTLVDATLGTTVTVPTLEGDATLDLKPGTQPGEERVLRGKGIPTLRGGGRGALRVLLNVQVPRDLTREQRELLERFRELESDRNYGSGGGGIRNAIRRAFG